jgi:Prokaryotic RING finger family 1
MTGIAVTSRRSTHTALPAARPPEGVARRTRRALVLAGWLGLVLGQTLGLLMADPALLTSRLSSPAQPLVIALAGMGLIGLLTGVVAGLALRGTNGVLRWAVAVFALLVGLIVFEAVYGLLRGQSLVAALRLADDGLKVAQAGLGILGATLGIQVGRMPAARAIATTPARRRPAARPPAQAQSPRTARRPARARTAQPGRSVALSVPAPSRPSIRRPKRRKGLRFTGDQVHLGKQTSAVCPYCLEEVKPNDPRGKVVCRICGTPHHADCWAITGKCEVPHLQT